MERKQHKNVVPCKHGRSDYHHHFYGVSLLFTCTYNIRQLNQVYKTYSFRGGVQGKKTLIPYTFNILDHFFYHFHCNLFTSKMLMWTLFERGGMSEKVYILYVHLNVDNYGWPLNNIYCLIVNNSSALILDRRVQSHLFLPPTQLSDVHTYSYLFILIFNNTFPKNSFLS